MAYITEVSEFLPVLDAFDLPAPQDVGDVLLIPFYTILKKVCDRVGFPGQWLL